MRVTTAQLLQAIYSLKRLVFLTVEISAITRSTVTSTTQSLRRLSEKGIIQKISHGIWGFVADTRFNPYLVIPFLNKQHRAYLSFISALNLHGVISQIPQVITVASTAHSTVCNTSVGSYDVHQIAPEMFDGFEWSEGGGYLVATPEKAYVDCLYLSVRKGKNYGYFPELDMKRLDCAKILHWVELIPDPAVKKAVIKKIL